MWMKIYKEICKAVIKSINWASYAPTQTLGERTVPVYRNTNGEQKNKWQISGGGSIRWFFDPVLGFNDKITFRDWTPRWILIVGDGNDPVTEDDYKLSGNQITDFSATEWTMVATENGYAVASVQLTANSPVTLREIGILKVMNTTDYLLVYREVLPSPVEMKTGDVYSFKLKFPIPGVYQEV